MDMWQPDSATIYRKTMLADPQANRPDGHYVSLTYDLLSK
jgi:hypothetical protein